MSVSWYAAMALLRIVPVFWYAAMALLCIVPVFALG